MARFLGSMAASDRCVASANVSWQPPWLYVLDCRETKRLWFFRMHTNDPF